MRDESLADMLEVLRDLRDSNPARWYLLLAILKQWAEDVRLYIKSIEGRAEITREDIERDMPRIWLG